MVSLIKDLNTDAHDKCQTSDTLYVQWLCVNMHSVFVVDSFNKSCVINS